MPQVTDRCIRAMLNDGAFRAMTVRTTDLVQQVLDVQEVQGEAAMLLGELVTGAVLIRETMAPAYRVQLILRDSLGSALVADAMPGGDTRGLARINDPMLGMVMGDDAILQVVRRLPRGASHEGIVAAGHGNGVSQGLMNYMQQSEQITSMIAVNCEIKDGRVLAAGGYVIQVLPTITEPPLAIMTERLEDFVNLGDRLVEWDANPATLLEELYYGFEYTMLDESEVQFHCACDAVRVISALATLPREEIEDLLSSDEVVSMDCDYCGSTYEVGREMLRTLLDKN